MKLNNNVIAIVVLIILLIVGSVYTSISYTKQRNNSDILRAQQISSDTLVAQLHRHNELLVIQLVKDSVQLSSNATQINNLLMQRSKLNSELSMVKKAVKCFTDGESIDYFIDYTGAVGSKMYVVDIDTSLIIAGNGIRKADSIFVEHDFYRRLTPRLDSIITVQDASIDMYIHSLNQYKLLMIDKDQEIAQQRGTINVVKAKMQKSIDNIKLQRDVAGTGAIVSLGLLILSLL